MKKTFATPAAKLANTIAIFEEEHPDLDWRPWHELGLISWMTLVHRYNMMCQLPNEDPGSLADYVLNVLESEAETFGWGGWVYADTVLVRIWETQKRDLNAEWEAMHRPTSETVN